MRIQAMAAAGAALAAVLAVAGCSVHPGAAAVVDGREIGTEDVRVATEQLRDVLVGPDGTTLPEATILQLLIDAPFYLEAADEAGVGVSREQAASVMDEAMAERELAAPDWTGASIDVARYVLVLSDLNRLDDGGAAAAAAEDAARAADVDVNPRYGQRDAETGFIDDVPAAWIVSGSQAPGAEG